MIIDMFVDSMESKRFRIGGYIVDVQGDDLVNGLAGLGSFAVFEERSELEEAALITFSYGGKDFGEITGKLLYSSENDGVVSEFYSTDETGRYFQKMRHEDGNELFMQVSCDEGRAVVCGSLMPQMLRFALWIGFGVMLSGSNAIAIHSSCIVYDGKAVLFLGESGTGKSTHTRMWRESIPGATLLNDDSPILRIEDGSVYVYGSPWSGKTPCYKQERYPLKACVRLSQAPYNKIHKLPVIKGYAALHPSCPPEFAYDERIYSKLSATLGGLLKVVSCYWLECLPDADAARLSHETLFGL